MGSEYPKQGDRRISVRQFPGLAKNQPRKSLSSTTAGGAAPSKVPKTALTPISRLKKFQKLRDRNLRKEVLYKNNIKKQLKMLENPEPEPSSSASPKSPQMLKELVKLENGEKKIENGQKENGEKALNGIEEELDVEENGVEDHSEVRRSPRRSRTKEQEAVEHVNEVEEEIQENNVNGDDLPEESPVKHIPEPIEVDVQIIETPSPVKTKRRSTPRRATPDVSSSTLSQTTVTTRDASTQDFNWVSDVPRITGRRPIRDMSPPRKRKSEEFSEEPASKRMAFTPSIPSPGWRFLSPFSLFKRTPRTVSSRPVDDSLFVNVSTDSDINVDLDSSDASDTPQIEESSSPGTSGDNVERPTPDSPSKSMNWLCRLM